MNSTAEPCPCCASGRINRYMMLTAAAERGPLRLPLWRCNQCGHAWLQTGDAHELIEEEYDQGYVGHRIDPFFETQCRAVILNEIGPLRPPPATLLDVGCGNGGFLLAAQEAGYEALGVDISAGAIEIVRSRGGKALSVDFLTHDFGRTFDVISMWDVVEHLREPIRFFQRARELLRPGGILVVKTPGVGMQALALTRVRPRWAGGLLQAPHHVHYWTRDSMDAIMRRAGFAEVIYWPPRAFRSAPESKSPTRKARRWVRTKLLMLAGSRNIFCAGRAEDG
jgi:2-polyprenyl-3-methyl-5-hydroxy-6-metoxy-1,4-benzoquinol methylase